MGKFNRSKKKYKKYQNDFSSNDASSSSTQVQANARESDIPGYYYDEEKKTYFKILSNSLSSVGSFVTNETIKKNKEESRRIKDRAKTAGEHRNSIISETSLSKHLKTKLTFLSQPLISVLNSVQCGACTCSNLERRIIRHRCQKLAPQPGWEMGQEATFTSYYTQPIENIQKLELTADCKKAVSVWSVKGIMLQWMQLITLSAKQKQTSSSVGTDLNLTFDDAGFVGTSVNKVTSMCWSPLSTCPGKTCVLYTTVCHVGYSGSRVSIFNLEVPSSEEAHLFSFDLGRHPVWSCAWNQQRSRFSVGCERKCHVIDVNTRCKWTYPTQHSDSLSQLFSSNNPHILYTGTRNGYVLVLDLRSSNQNSECVKLNQKYPVVCIRTLKDENYVMASDFSGVIKTWDIRFRKDVRSYTGLVNSHYQLPFYLNDTEKFVYATGSDGYFKVWDVTEGFLLNSIPPPLALQVPDSLPVSHLSENWGGVDGNFGVVTAMAKSFFLYS